MTRDSENGQPEPVGDILARGVPIPITPTCPDCGKTREAKGLGGWTGLTRNSLCLECEAVRAAHEKAEAEQLYLHRIEERWNALCPPLYRKTDPSRLPAKPLADVLVWPYGSKGLLAIGPTGTGKTRSLFLLVKRLLEEGRTIQAFDCAGFGHECQRRFMDGTGTEWVDRLAHLEVCFFDDFGKMPLTERVEAELVALVERRTANELPILATSNMTGEALMSKASQDRGAPLVRRLREFCDVVVFEGKGD